MLNFSYPVLTEAQIEAQRETLEDGIHPFKTIDILGGISKNGNNMATLTLEIWNEKGKLFKAKDFLVGIESMSYKTRNYWISVGKPEIYEIGDTPLHEFLNQCGLVKTRLEKEPNGNRKFIRIVDYIAPPEKTEKEMSTPKIMSSDEEGLDELDDDIPF